MFLLQEGRDGGREGGREREKWEEKKSLHTCIANSVKTHKNVTASDKGKRV